MEAQNIFQVVLDDDEQVMKLLHPHQGRAWFSNMLGLLLWSVVMVPFGILMIIFHEPNSFEEDDTLGLGIALLVIWAVVSLIMLIGIALWCHKTMYALTNKRVLIRTGHIGVDYKSLDFNMVGALAVNVNVIDKIMHQNTGSIAFGSMASPMTSNNASKFNFMFVHDPYKVYKEIKAHIDQHKVSEAAKN